MPFTSRSFDFVLCRAAFKNFSEPLQALQEMYRVLDTGGRAVIIDLRKDASAESIDRAVNQMHVGSVNGLITKFTFRHVLLKRAYTKRDFEQFVDQTAFGPVEIDQNDLGLELTLYRGRRQA